MAKHKHTKPELLNTFWDEYTKGVKTYPIGRGVKTAAESRYGSNIGDNNNDGYFDENAQYTETKGCARTAGRMSADLARFTKSPSITVDHFNQIADLLEANRPDDALGGICG